MDRDELIERLKVALAFDAQKGTDAQWSELLAQAHNALEFLSRLQPSKDGEPVANRLANIVREAGYWSAEIALGTDGGHEVTLFTKEGYDAIRALAGKDATGRDGEG